MYFKVRCPQCKTLLNCPEELRGRKIRCKKCPKILGLPLKKKVLQEVTASATSESESFSHIPGNTIPQENEHISFSTESEIPTTSCEMEIPENPSLHLADAPGYSLESNGEKLETPDCSVVHEPIPEMDTAVSDPFSEGEETMENEMSSPENTSLPDDVELKSPTSPLALIIATLMTVAGAGAVLGYLFVSGYVGSLMS